MVDIEHPRVHVEKFGETTKHNIFFYLIKEKFPLHVTYRLFCSYKIYLKDSTKGITQYYLPTWKAGNAGCKENHFYSLPFGQAEAYIY